MTVTITYFGMLAEATQCHEETISFSGKSVSELLDMLFEKHPGLKKKDFQVAQNHDIVSKNAKITNSNIVLLPPFSGG